MLKVLSKVTYTDGSLFQVKDDRTGEVRLLSEPTLGRYAGAKRVANASVVHRDGARVFVRLASGVPSKEVDKQIPLFKSDYDNDEAEQARKWFNFVNAKPTSSVKSTTPKVSVGKEVNASSLWDDEEEDIAPTPVKKEETLADKLRSLDREDEYVLTEDGIGVFKFKHYRDASHTVDIYFYRSKSACDSGDPIAGAYYIPVRGLETINDLLDVEDEDGRGAFRELTESAYKNRKDVYVKKGEFSTAIQNLHGYDTVIYREELGDGCRFEIRVYLDLEEEENSGDGLIFELLIIGVSRWDEDEVVDRWGETKKSCSYGSIEDILDLSAFDLSNFSCAVENVSDLMRYLDLPPRDESYAEDMVGREVYIDTDGGHTYWFCTDKERTKPLKSGKYRIRPENMDSGQWMIMSDDSIFIDQVCYDAGDLISECKRLGVNSVVEYINEHHSFCNFVDGNYPYVPITDEEVEILKANGHENWVKFFKLTTRKVATDEVVEEKGGYMAVGLERLCDRPKDFYYTFDYEDGVIFTIGRIRDYKEWKGVLLKADDYDMYADENEIYIENNHDIKFKVLEVISLEDITRGF